MRPILTVEELVRAQQEAIKVYNEYGIIGRRDVYAILGLNIDQADGFYIEDVVSDDDIRAFVRQTALKHYIVQQNNDPGSFDSPFEYKYDGRLIADVKSVNETSNSIVLNLGNMNHVDHLINKYIWREDDQMLNQHNERIEKAQKALNDELLKKHKLTYEDVYGVLGLDTDGLSEQQKNIVLYELPVPDEAEKKIDRALRTIYERTYFPDKLPHGLRPIHLWQTDNGCTTVEWNDETKTTVRIEDGGRATMYGGFCACVAKKLYGSTGEAIKAMQLADDNAKRPAEIKRRKHEKHKKMNMELAERRRENEKKRREDKIQTLMEDIYAKREAERRVAEADERKEYGL